MMQDGNGWMEESGTFRTGTTKSQGIRLGMIAW